MPPSRVAATSRAAHSSVPTHAPLELLCAEILGRKLSNNSKSSEGLAFTRGSVTRDPHHSATSTIPDAVLTEIIGAAMDAIVSVDAQSHVIMFNAAAEKMFGRTAADMIGQPLDVLIPVRLRALHAQHVEAFARTGNTRRQIARFGEIHGLRSNGEEFPAEASISRMSAPQGAVYTVILRDISERKRVEEALHASTKLVQSIVDSSDDAIIGKTLEGVILSWNAAAERLFGYSTHEAVGQTMLMLIPPERQAEEPAILARIGKGERVEHFETVRVRKDGQRIDVSATISPLRDSSGTVVGASKIARDITEQKRTHEKMLRLSRIHAVISGINSLIVRSRDRQSLLEAACRIAVEQGNFGAAWIGLINLETGKVGATAWAGQDTVPLERDKLSFHKRLRGRQGLVGRALLEKVPAYSNDIAAEPDETVTRRMRVSLDYGYRSLIALPLIVQGAAIGVLELFAKERGFIDEGELRLLTEIANDIAFALEHIEQEERLHYLAYHDPLTGLANRVLLHDRLEQAIRAAKHTDFQVALLFGDIKGFRQINDTLGRQAGDALLRELGERLKVLSPEPENVARISADYFAGIIGNVRAISELAHLIERSIAGLLSKPYNVGSKKLRVGIRTGIAVYPGDGDDADTLFKHAEVAHRRAKARSVKYLFFQPEMNAMVAETLLLESKLKTAMERNEFELYYQPKVDAAHGRITGLEGLIRWNDPEHGLVLPGSFVPVLEETGMILEVGQWVIRQALTDCRHWISQGLHPPRIAVNVSAVQLQQENFVETVQEAIGDDASDKLDFEITETVLMHNIESNIVKLTRLRDLGIDIAIDDFGTGYSSLSYLTRLPVSTVKIDRAFVLGMTADANNMAIVTTIISLARSLKLKVVAEGVETEEQARFLRLLGCDQLQGYLFSRPASATQVASLLGSV
jgi:PAS domain S-box-containing protein/diguanylate cyclase (GGDEF)-like protein